MYKRQDIYELFKTPFKAIEEVYRTLVPGGIFAASIAGEGTAERFLKSYGTVRELHGGGDFRLNPIGSMRLANVEKIFSKSDILVLPLVMTQ